MEAFIKPFSDYTVSEAFLGILTFLALVCVIYNFVKKRGI